ncbi:hypothetical protein A2U01_0033505, partial [Trifolium medium]|nr:hypothetical protein [Trifolium medium]
MFLVTLVVVGLGPMTDHPSIWLSIGSDVGGSSGYMGRSVLTVGSFTSSFRDFYFVLGLSR